jgi:hypothetical protein
MKYKVISFKSPIRQDIDLYISEAGKIFRDDNFGAFCRPIAHKIEGIIPEMRAFAHRARLSAAICGGDPFRLVNDKDYKMAEALHHICKVQYEKLGEASKLELRTKLNITCGETVADTLLLIVCNEPEAFEKAVTHAKKEHEVLNPKSAIQEALELLFMVGMMAGAGYLGVKAAQAGFFNPRLLAAHQFRLQMAARR